MNLAIGILMLVLGVIAFVAWFAELVPFFKGLLVCSLLLWGVAGIVIGLAKMRAKGHLDKAKVDEKSVDEKSVAELDARVSE